ncbi:MAG: HAD-IA family hydrolase [Devosia sp.]
MTKPRRPAVPRAALFDLDGTLIDSVPDITLAIAELMQTENLEPLNEDAVRRMVGHGIRMLVQRAFAGHGIALDDAELTVKTETMMHIYPRHLIGRTTLMQGGREALAFFSAAGSKLAVVTNKPQGATETILRHFGLSDRFALVLGDTGPASNGGLARKPEPDMLIFALQRLGIHPEDAIMVGDSGADIQAAAAAGVFSVAVRRGYSTEPLESFRPDLVLDSLTDLPSAFAASATDG